MCLVVPVSNIINATMSSSIAQSSKLAGQRCQATNKSYKISWEAIAMALPLHHQALLLCSGELSACACQSIAFAAHMDGIQHEAVVKLAATGSWGKHTNNISRDLKTFITRESRGTFAMPTAVNIPCWNPRTSRNENADFSYFDPASVVEAFYSHTELFDYFFQPKLVESFWQNIRQDDPRRLMLFQEAGLQQNDLPHVIPLWIHGDGVEFVDGHSLMTLSFGSVLNVGPSLDSSLLLFAFPKDCADAKTWEHVWAHIVPSFLQMQQGVSAAGTPLAGKWKFVIWQIMGDQKCFLSKKMYIYIYIYIYAQHSLMKYQYFGHKISIFEVRFLQQNIDIPGPYLDSQKQGLKQEIDTQKYRYSRVWKY